VFAHGHYLGTGRLRCEVGMGFFLGVGRGQVAADETSAAVRLRRRLHSGVKVPVRPRYHRPVNRRLLRRGDTGWGAAGGELPVRNKVRECMNNVNSIRPDDGTSLRQLCEVRPVARASAQEVPRPGGEGDRDSVRVLKATVNKGKAAPPSAGGWRRNGRKRKRDKQGDLPGPERCSWPQGPKSRPAGVRASVVAMKRVTTVEQRDAGKWKAGSR
jgi:hypothetical protein